MKMRQQDLFKICHGCNDEVRNGQEHWKAKIGDHSITITVFFHVQCYERYKRAYARDLKWAVHKPKEN